MTSREEIAAWFDDGVRQGARFLIVAADTFKYENYPVFITGDAAEASTEADRLQNAPMSRVMEIYDLAGDREAQLDAVRNWALPEPLRRPSPEDPARTFPEPPLFPSLRATASHGGRTVEARVLLLSESRISIAIDFEAILDGSVGQMALIWDGVTGTYRNLFTGSPIALDPIPSGPEGPPEALITAELVATLRARHVRMYEMRLAGNRIGVNVDETTRYLELWRGMEGKGWAELSQPERGEVFDALGDEGWGFFTEDDEGNGPVKHVRAPAPKN